MGNEEIRNERSLKFFSDLTLLNCTENLDGNVNDLNEKISLNISISNIERNINYNIQIFNFTNPSNKIPLSEIETCTINNNGNEAICQKALLIQYYFEKEQPLLIEVTKFNENISNIFPVLTTVGCIMGSRKNTIIKQIQGLNENIIIKAEKIKQSDDILALKFDVKSIIPLNFNEIKNKFIFILSTPTTKIYKSECIDDMGNFNQVKIPTMLLSDDIFLIVHDYKRKIIADIKTNVQELISHKTYEISMSKRRKFSLTSSSFLTRNYTFVDYLQAGVQIGLSIAIDFTGSNGPPTERRSLHFIGGSEPNQYERAIYTCGNILAYYDYDQQFPCYGFGAKLNGTSVKLFNLNLQIDPNIHTIQNIISEYHRALSIVKLWGPTYFTPILKATNEMIKMENNKLKYNILMILTDGVIDDVQSTINELVEGSFLPLSVIIIGVGKADFSTMNVLDADDNELVNSSGVKAARDLVQFVPFLNYENDPQKLAQEVLAEVPKQMLQYYEQNNLDPIKLMS